MILVAAAALATVGLETLHRHTTPSYFVDLSWKQTWHTRLHHASQVVVVLLAVSGVATLASSVARHRGGAPRPGIVACIAASLGCLVRGVTILMTGLDIQRTAGARGAAWRWQQNAISYVADSVGSLAESAALAVVAAWIVLAMTGLWRRERTRIDDMGIAVGCGWIALHVASVAYFTIWNLFL
jgi:hypothetical protein